MACRVLVIEDEALVAILVEDMLIELGFEVVGVASRLATGLALAETVDCDLSVLDVNLGGGRPSFPIAERLQQRGIPFVFATGYGAAGVEQRFDAPVISKPFRREDLARALHKARADASGS